MILGYFNGVSDGSIEASTLWEDRLGAMIWGILPYYFLHCVELYPMAHPCLPKIKIIEPMT